MRMHKLHLFCASGHRHAPYDRKWDFNNGSKACYECFCENASAILKGFAPYQDTLEGTK